MANISRLIENVSLETGALIEDLTRRFASSDPKVTEEKIQRVIQDRVAILLNSVRALRNSLVVIGNISNDDVSNLHLDINAFEVQNSVNNIAKIEVSIHGGKVMIIVKPEAASIFRESLQDGLLYQRGWSKKLILLKPR